MMMREKVETDFNLQAVCVLKTYNAFRLSKIVYFHLPSNCHAKVQSKSSQNPSPKSKTGLVVTL